MQNLLANGGFNINQRGQNSYSTPNRYTVDRWKLLTVGTVAVESGAGNFVSGTSGLRLESQAGNSLQLVQVIENPAEWRGRNVVLTMQVKTSTPNRIRLLLTDGTTTMYSNFHPGNGAFQQLAVATLVNASATLLHAGVETTAGPACTAYVDNAMLVPGTTPVAFQPLEAAQDWARCLRWYRVMRDVQWGGVGAALSGGRYLYAPLVYDPMAAVPTATLTLKSNFNVEAVTTEFVNEHKVTLRADDTDGSSGTSGMVALIDAVLEVM